MFDDPNQIPTKIGIILVPEFSLMAFTSAIEPLRSANRVSGRELYEWDIVSVDGSAVAASNGVEIIPEGSIDLIDRPELIIVISGMDVQRYGSGSILSFLRRASRQGVALGASSTGAYILAKAGLLDDRRCTIHWENLESFREVFPHIEISSDLYEIDRDRITCSGGTAGLDMMLFLIAKQHGENLASDISDQFIHDRIREPHAKQRMALRTRLGVTHPKLISVIEDMAANLEFPLAQSELATRTGISSRQLERLFRKYMGTTPTKYYLSLRLNRARQLLEQTSMSILSVALACGFVSASHFSKCFREYFDKTPRQERSHRVLVSEFKNDTTHHSDVQASF
ncbi:MAG: AraC family transcriptional regulator [Rhodospirillaceae bacterium]|nr:AraC family transcriptional regulator [Rhodospirillaceae bacterium]|tara:strand:+ start:480 stop:1502 length:1023 start_codon:yes stop_codon:yes gene_type:complete